MSRAGDAPRRPLRSPLRRRLIGAALVCVAAPAAVAQSWAWDDGTVPFVVTPDEVVDRMLRIADVRAGDRLIDLGSGDGRIVIGAAQRGAQALGIDIDPTLVERAGARAQEAGVAARAQFRAQDLFDTDLSQASVITMYLLPEFNLKLRPRLLALKPGTRVVSHDWHMGDWRPDETIELRTPEKPVGLGGVSRVYLWVIPAELRGRWRAEVPGHGGRWEFGFEQQRQEIQVAARADGRELVVRGSRLLGEEVKMVVTGVVDGRPWNHLFKGRIAAGRISGEVLVSDGDNQRTLKWTASRLP
ncbi:MAG: class I SAM-dependent methyltransferase [Betaproteobacteria bacterium]|nr:class I SAM-dependent methyltransferase [Betaproteobacteria bacterium]